MNIYEIIILKLYVVVDVVVVVEVVRYCWCCHCCWCCRCHWCRTLLLTKLLNPCILIKLGAHALLNVNHSYHVDLRAYALHVDFRSLYSNVDFRGLCSSVALRAYALTRWLVPHAYCIVKLLLCHCIVVNVEMSSSLLNSCCCFKF